MKTLVFLILLTLPILAEKPVKKVLELRQLHDSENMRIDLSWFSKGFNYRYDVYRVYKNGTKEVIFSNWKEPEKYEMKVWYNYGHWIDGEKKLLAQYILVQVVETKEW